MEDMDDAPKTLPYRAEYAKSGRGQCKGCKQTVDKDELRLARMTKSKFFDGMQANWYHFDCFFKISRPKSVGDIGHFELLRYADQDRIRNKMDAANPAKTKSVKSNIEEFVIEYAKTSRAQCIACENPIKKQELKIGKLDFEADATVAFGVKVHRWYHPNCFVEVRESLDFYASGKDMKGFRDLEHEDQAMIEKQLPASKKRKMKGDEGKPSKISKADQQFEKDVRKQSDAMYALRDQIKEAIENKLMKQKHLKEFLTYNNQEPAKGPNQALERLTDIMVHGALKKCSECKNGQYVFRSGHSYYCMGSISEFAKCINTTEDPERVPFRLPRDYADELIEACPFLAPFKKGKVAKRLIPKHEAPVTGAAVTPKDAEKTFARSSAHAGPRVDLKPLKKYRFIVEPAIVTSNLKDKIKEWGGTALVSFRGNTESIAALITTKGNVKDKKDKFVNEAKGRGIPVVSVKFLDNLKETGYDVIEEMQKSLIVDWFKPNELKSYLTTTYPDMEKKTEEKEKEKRSKYELEMKKIKLKMKNGAVVDPESGLEDCSHVYKEGDRFYTAVLNRVDVDEGRNSYYKLQLIESDKGRNYHVFRSWGRVGTTIGKEATTPVASLEEAKDLFNQVYFEKTRNEFGRPFKNHPGAYTLMDIDFGEKKHLEKIVPDIANSKLELPIQKLVCKIFDEENMKQTLMGFELDLEKMPLGKISRAQIMKAYTALNDAIKLLETEDKSVALDKKQRQMVEVTNRFFTHVPHNFGARDVPLLKDIDFVKAKIDMLDNMLEIELAYELLRKGDGIDGHYESLECELRTLEKSSQMWQILEKYLANTHAPTHVDYTLELQNIFAVERNGENKRYLPWQDFHNRKLLWHGSRTSNYVGILSQGLRIAPPEAPVTGYMFGKGVYFADMVSKSANYCFPSRQDTATGLLLLCEVALGDMHELRDQNCELMKAPNGKHSVKGCGKTIPDSTEEYVLPTGAVVPYGKPTPSGIKKSSLLYNEYIVYDTAQVNILYLLEVKFKFDKIKY